MTVKKTEEAPKKRGKGRPSKYNDDLADIINFKIWKGESQKKIARDVGVCEKTIINWKSKPEFLQRSACAREEASFKFNARREEVAEWLMGKIKQAAESGQPLPKGVVDGAKVVMQELARSAAIRNDELFGDRKTVKVDAKTDGAGLADVYAKIAEAVKDGEK